jgi:hypothetical protein
MAKMFRSCLIVRFNLLSAAQGQGIRVAKIPIGWDVMAMRHEAGVRYLVLGKILKRRKMFVRDALSQ